MRFFPLLSVTLAVLVLCGCRSAPLTYYTLTPTDGGDTASERARPAMQAGKGPGAVAQVDFTQAVGEGQIGLAVLLGGPAR